MTSTQPDLSIVIPAYREEKRIGKTLDSLAAFLKTDRTLKDKNIEVIVVSADSSDNTHKVVLDKKKLFRDLKLVKPGSHVGKGRDVRVGMLQAHGKAIMFMDADLATPLKYIPLFLKEFQAGSDVVVATRNLHRHHPSLPRRALSNVGNILYRILGGVWIEDSQCGFKLFSDKATQTCFSKMTILGWGFDMEVLTIAKVNNFTITPIRVNNWKSVAGGTFNESVFKSALASFSELLHIFLHRLLGHYATDESA